MKGEGTNSSSSSSQPSSSSNNSTSSPGKVTGSDVERYKADIINSATQIEDTMKLIEGIADSDVKSYKQKKSEVQLSLGGAKATTKKLKNLQAPLSYRRTGEDKAIDGTVCGLFSTSL